MTDKHQNKTGTNNTLIYINKQKMHISRTMFKNPESMLKIHANKLSLKHEMHIFCMLLKVLLHKQKKKNLFIVNIYHSFKINAH